LPIHPIVPLSLLEAIRNLDTPLNDGLPAELAQETFTKRLGLSTTVAAQIERYREMVAKAAPVLDEEVIQVFRLVGRRPDATLVYSDAGRRAARYAARARAGRLPAYSRLLPRGLRHQAGERAAKRALHRIFKVELVREPGGLMARVSDSLATRAGFEGSGCQYYGALSAELLRMNREFEGSMIHERCRSRGDEACRWKAAEPEGRW
jgi:hypothetical protein